jgi:hypothetical protein
MPAKYRCTESDGKWRDNTTLTNYPSVHTEILVQETQMDANAKKPAKFIATGAGRMSTLVEDLLSFASTGIQEAPRCVDLQHAVAQATMNLAPHRGDRRESDDRDVAHRKKQRNSFWCASSGLDQ